MSDSEEVQQIIDWAIDTVAKAALWSAYERWTEEGWENIPDIGRYDYDRVVERMGRLLPKDATTAEYETAYALLESRVEGDKSA